MALHRKVVVLYHNLFNIKLAAISVLCNGSITAWVNWDYGPRECIYAALSQAVVSFFSTGITGRLIQHFSVIEKPLPSYFFGTAAAASLTFVGSFTAHWLNGTPEMLVSCLSPTVISFTTGFGTNFMTRRGHLLPGNYPK